jgi:hypothetical protein
MQPSENMKPRAALRQSAPSAMARAMSPLTAKGVRFRGARINSKKERPPVERRPFNVRFSGNQMWAGVLFARYAAKPRPAKPNDISTQAAGSGTPPTDLPGGSL